MADDPLDVPEPPMANVPESTSAEFERHASAPRFQTRNDNKPDTAAEVPNVGMNDIAKLLAAALQHSDRRDSPAGKRPSWDKRKALVCASPAYRESIAELLADNNYEVFVAENLAQAQGRMREERMDVLVLDADFDPVEQGVAFITREVRLLRPAERRRFFFVYVVSGVRTMDPHAAFLQDVNLVVNPSDIEQLPEALNISIRHFNELYRPLNRALDVAPI
jgi:CheY-like chemotaxis protein